MAPALALAEGPKYKTIDGCDEGRTREWESIIIEFDGFPEEQEDARGVRDLNVQVCKDLKAGAITQDEASRRYDGAVDTWTERVKERQERRKRPAGTPGLG